MINSNLDNTLLHIAAARGDVPIVDALLRHGFHVDSLASGYTALHKYVNKEIGRGGKEVEEEG